MTLTSEMRSKYGYEDVGPFSEGLAWVRKGEEEFHIRPDGQRVD